MSTSAATCRRAFARDRERSRGRAADARLHERQFHFALQSLTLWREITHDMFRLWYLAETDLLSVATPYALRNTGQGLQRVQPSPRTYKAMQEILQCTQQQVRRWIGSSMIHMGDHNVPNALMFIDKYTQISRILNPILSCLETLAKLHADDDGVRALIDSGYGGMKKVRRDILCDFFRSAFDGSGADNNYDAGSCIDGRLTSAWNWCSQLPTKPFPLFKLTGFIGFDGEFREERRRWPSMPCARDHKSAPGSRLAPAPSRPIPPPRRPARGVRRTSGEAVSGAAGPASRAVAADLDVEPVHRLREHAIGGVLRLGLVRRELFAGIRRAGSAEHAPFPQRVVDEEQPARREQTAVEDRVVVLGEPPLVAVEEDEVER